MEIRPQSAAGKMRTLVLLALLCSRAFDASAGSPFGNNPEHGDGQINDGYDGADRSSQGTRQPSSSPWSSRAGDELGTSRSLISAQEAAAATAAAAAASAASCNGSTCAAATNIVRMAHSAAAAVSATAGSRLLDAEQLRKQMLTELGGGRYSPDEVASVRNLLRETPTPPDREIRALPENVRDLARGLATNYQEMKLLDEKRRQYGKVASGAEELHRKLSGVVARAETIRPDSSGAFAGTGEHENARYPEKSPAAFGSRNSGDGNSMITGGTSAFLSKGNLDMKIAAPEKLAGGKGTASGTSKAPSGESESDGRKLTGSGADLIAGMISELDFDLSKSLPTEPMASAGVAPVSGTEAKLQAESAGPASSVGEVLLASVEGAGGGNGSDGLGALGRKLASAGPLPEIDFLDVDKDLFRRVNEQMRRRAGKELGAK